MDIQMGGHHAVFEEGKAVLFVWTGAGMRYRSPVFLRSDILLAARSWTFSCSPPLRWQLPPPAPREALVSLSIATCAIASSDVS